MFSDFFTKHSQAHFHYVPYVRSEDFAPLRESGWGKAGRWSVNIFSESHKAFCRMVLFLPLSNLTCLSLGLDEAAYISERKRNKSTAQSSRTMLIQCLHFSHSTWVIALISSSSGCKVVDLKFAAGPGEQVGHSVTLALSFGVKVTKGVESTF